MGPTTDKVVKYFFAEVHSRKITPSIVVVSVREYREIQRELNFTPHHIDHQDIEISGCRVISSKELKYNEIIVR